YLSSRILFYSSSILFFFFFNDTATTEIYTLSLHDALPICRRPPCGRGPARRPPRRSSSGPGGYNSGAASWPRRQGPARRTCRWGDRKSTRLNSSHLVISYAVFCLKKKNKQTKDFITDHMAL